MSINSQVVSGTAGVVENITLPYPGDPNFSVFGGSPVAGETKNVNFKTETVAGVSKYEGYTGPYDPNFSVY